VSKFVKVLIFLAVLVVPGGGLALVVWALWSHRKKK